MAAPIHPHQQVSFSPHPRQHLLFLVFWVVAILTGVRRFLIVVLVCVSLMISNVEHLFMYLLAICMSSSENVYSSPLPIFNWVI